MSGSNPFDDLATDEEEPTGEEDDGTADRDPDPGPTAPERSAAARGSSTPGDANGEADARGSPGRASDSEGTTVDGPTLTNSSPPFPYSEAEQKQMYVQDGLWDEFEDLGFDAELELRRTFEVRNVEQRELDTAVVRLVLDRLSPREIAETVVRMRGFEPPDAE